jgi:hypothetical protein
MTLTIELTPEQERRLQFYAERHNLAFENAMDDWLMRLPDPQDADEDDAFQGEPAVEDIDEMVAEFAAILPPNLPSLPKDFSRADIYFDHD